MSYKFLSLFYCLFTIGDWVTGEGKRRKVFWASIKDREPLSDIDFLERLGMAADTNDLVLWIRKEFADQLDIPAEKLRPDDEWSDYSRHEGFWIMSLDDIISPLGRKLGVPLPSRVHDELERDFAANGKLTIGTITKCLVLVVHEVVPKQTEVEA
jgi:hypothetical protein